MLPYYSITCNILIQFVKELKWKLIFTTTELTKRSDYNTKESHTETFQHNSDSSSSVSSSKGPNGSKFDATKTSIENDTHTKSDQPSVEVKNKNGEFSASKSSGVKDGFFLVSSSDVHASKDKNGSKFDAEKGSNELDTQNSSSDVHTVDNHGNHFDSSKTFTGSDTKLQGSSNSASASKGKDGSKFTANKNSFESDNHYKLNSSQVQAGDSHGNNFDAIKSISESSGHTQRHSAMLTPQKVKVEANTMQTKSPLNKMIMVNGLVAVLVPKIAMEINSMQVKSPVKLIVMVKSLQTVLVPQR
ncbi:hypothetical protein F8M41_013284 [Gigaspora margarita]|uniref:Uncharacterized protein n=1 Tax=Gigaspora margarita TaxID=4874 RepID=A0A8H3X004_GIGMA|nr:hypothetical protein F8M41_013284 [Gigaspora margarita]